MKTAIDVCLQFWLCIIAIAVVTCLSNDWATWGWIIAYWIVLSVKNVFDLYAM